VLSMLEPQDQESLLLLFYPKSASPGDRVIRRGDRTSEMYFISSGAVEVLAEGRTIRLEAGSLFGEMAPLSGKRRNADFPAVEYCHSWFSTDATSTGSLPGILPCAPHSSTWPTGGAGATSRHLKRLWRLYETPSCDASCHMITSKPV
jgi:hypothetical protein